MNKRSFLVLASAGVLLALLTNSCVKDKGKLPVVVPPPVSVCDSATYTKKIKAIIDAKCATCHSPAGGPTGGVNLTTYAEVSGKSSRINARALVEGTMPQTGSPQLTADEKALIQCWLDKGTPE